VPVPRDEPPVSLHEAAARLGVHYMTAYRYVRTGRLPAHRDGTEWRVERADLDAFLAGPASAPNGSAPKSRRRVDRRGRLVERLIVGDEPGSWTIVEDALASGHEPAELYLEILGPALTEIGDRWEAGQVSVAQEHQASVVVQRLIGRLGPRFARRGRRRGAIVVGAPPGDAHGLPSALFADLLRGDGFDVVDLGADTPTASFVEEVGRTERLVAVAISATSRPEDGSLAELIAALHRAASVPIVLGGRAIASEEQARAFGADHWAPTTPAGLALLAELARMRTEGPA
jgi:excisionase family DNA binding protein